MDWYEVCGKYDKRTVAHGGRLSSLSAEWQRELAALRRLEDQVNNGGYLQFLLNRGKESYVYASQALKKIGAHRMAEIVDCCQTLIEEHFVFEGKPPGEQKQLMPNRVIDLQGNVVKDAGSALPDPIVARIYELSYEFMEYPEDLPKLGLSYYRSFVEGDTSR